MVNEWDEEEQGLYLAGSLKGATRGVINDMCLRGRRDFNCLKAKLQQMFEIACEETFGAKLRKQHRR